VNPDDEQQLSAALNVLIRERSSRETLAHAARERACSFTLRRLADQNLALYTELVSKHSGGEGAQACARTSASGGSESALL
jgi:glycosyltransferase involved in cell wall biosynthesis